MKLKMVLIFSIIAGSSLISRGQEVNADITITGKVRNADNNPVEGAAVFIDRVKTGSVTDQNGNYTVRADSGAKVIMVFDMTYGVSREFINRRYSVDLTLPGKAHKNNYVSIGYGTTKRKHATNQVGRIDGQKQEFTTYNNIFDMIRGRLPGVEVNGSSIKISGSSSLNVSTEPLFVVNGIIVSSIDHIAPHDVKSIEVLKGPAASVYGIKGSNGVIMITLMSGRD